MFSEKHSICIFQLLMTTKKGTINENVHVFNELKLIFFLLIGK